ncbi:hypothetical protein [Pseudogemmobacter sp. W21_MBD1_M6]|uniref:hypothetical protein n=1 Tax=Pseudogemmobacter sp. W21_MBD1_M6 TaxID=3240271 RepID=UPI003F966CBE
MFDASLSGDSDSVVGGTVVNNEDFENVETGDRSCKRRKRCCDGFCLVQAWNLHDKFQDAAHVFCRFAVWQSGDKLFCREYLLFSGNVRQNLSKKLTSKLTPTVEPNESCIMKSTPLIGEATVTFGTQQLIDGQGASQIILDFEFVPADFGPKARDTIDLLNQIMAILANELNLAEIGNTIRIEITGNLLQVADAIGVSLPDGAEEVDLTTFRFGKDLSQMNPLEEQYAAVFGFGSGADAPAVRMN